MSQQNGTGGQKDLPWMRFWMDDWFDDPFVKSLDPYARNVYLLLCCLSFRFGTCPWCPELLLDVLGSDDRKHRGRYLEYVKRALKILEPHFISQSPTTDRAGREPCWRWISTRCGAKSGAIRPGISPKSGAIKAAGPDQPGLDWKVNRRARKERVEAIKFNKLNEIRVKAATAARWPDHRKRRSH